MDINIASKDNAEHKSLLILNKKHLIELKKKLYSK